MRIRPTDRLLKAPIPHFQTHHFDFLLFTQGYDEIKVKHDQVKRELAETKEELRVKLHQYSRQNRHFKDLERKYRELTEMHNRLKDRMEEKENELQEKEKVFLANKYCQSIRIFTCVHKISICAHSTNE